MFLVYQKQHLGKVLRLDGVGDKLLLGVFGGIGGLVCGSLTVGLSFDALKHFFEGLDRLLLFFGFLFFGFLIS